MASLCQMGKRTFTFNSKATTKEIYFWFITKAKVSLSGD